MLIDIELILDSKKRDGRKYYMKRLFSAIVLWLAIVVLSGPMSALAADGVSLFIDGVALNTDVPPTIYNSRVLVPFRAAGEGLNSYVEYYPENKTIVAQNNGTTIKLQINSKTAYVNNQAVTLDTPPLMRNGRTLIPMRFFGEAFGCSVEWDSTTDSVHISSPPVSPMEVTAFYALGGSYSSSWTDLFGTTYPQTAVGNTGKISTLALGWYSLDESGKLITDSSSGWRKPQGWEQVLAAADLYHLRTEMVVHLTNQGGILSSLLADATASSAAIDSIVAEAGDYDGVNLDFEGLGWNDTEEALQNVQQNFSRFVLQLSEGLAEKNLKLTLTLHPPNSAYKGYDYASLGKAAHSIIIMAYDYGQKPEPVSLVTQAVEMAAAKVPAQKLLLGITAVGETPDSIRTKVGIAKKYNLKGIALWRLGLVTPDMWEVLGNISRSL